MPLHRGWWLALLVVQIVIALAGLASGLGILLGTSSAPSSPDFFANREVRGVAVLLLGAFTGVTACCLMLGHRLALVFSALSSILLLGWMHRVGVALGQQTAVATFFMVLGVLQLAFLLLVLGVQRGIPAPPRPAPLPEPAPVAHEDLED
jgi:hypothetical protein